MAAVRWTRHLKQLCWSTSTIGQRRDGTYMSVSSSSNFLRERHRTRHCYKSGMHIIYKHKPSTFKTVPGSSRPVIVWGDHTWVHLSFHTKDKGLYAYMSILYLTSLFCITLFPQQCCDLPQDLYFDSDFPYCPSLPTCHSWERTEL